jgi:hypothetical protein
MAEMRSGWVKCFFRDALSDLQVASPQVAIDLVHVQVLSRFNYVNMLMWNRPNSALSLRTFAILLIDVLNTG